MPLNQSQSKHVTIQSIISMILMVYIVYISGAVVTFVLAPLVIIMPFSTVFLKLRQILGSFGYQSISVVYNFLYDGKIKISIDKNWKLNNNIDGYLGVREFLKHSCINTKDSPHHLFISNHITYLDWMYISFLTTILEKGYCVSYVSKSSVKQIPVIGWATWLLSFIFLERDWDKDQGTLDKHLKSLIVPNNPTFIGIFPEGTILCKEADLKSKLYSSKNGLPILNHVLTPRVLGTKAMVALHGSSLDGILDITIGLLPGAKYPDDVYNIKELLLYAIHPNEVCFHLNYIPPEDIPSPEDQKFSEWLNDLFVQKDKRLNNFYEKKTFQGPDSELIYEGNILEYSFPLVLLYVTIISILFVAISVYLISSIL